jgi:hypothetical protein
MSEATITPVLAVIYAQRMSADLTPSELGLVRNMVARGVHTGFTQADVVMTLGTTQKSASEMFAALRRKGYLLEGSAVRVARGRGRPAQTYDLTAPPRIAFDGLGAWTRMGEPSTRPARS